MQLLWHINLTLSHFNKKSLVDDFGDPEPAQNIIWEKGEFCATFVNLVRKFFYSFTFSKSVSKWGNFFRSMKCALCFPFSTWPIWPARKQSRRTPTCGDQMKMKTTSETLRLRTRTISTLAIQTRNPQAPQQIIRLSEFCRSSFSLSWNKVGLGIFFSDISKQVFQNAFSRYKPVSIYSLHHEHEQRNG